MKIEKLEKIKFIYKPILLGGLHNLSKITPPAFIEAKKNFMINDCQLVAKKFNISFKFNDKFPINSLSLMRGLLATDENKRKKYIQSFFDAYWSLNLDLSNNEIIEKILKELNIDCKFFFEKINEQKIKNLLKQLTQDAFDKEIFGAPTFILNKKLFWGQDRLNYVLDEYKSSI
jgi:2-hydroxychromene-2-carboxylate isomerase